MKHYIYFNVDSWQYRFCTYCDEEIKFLVSAKKTHLIKKWWKIIWLSTLANIYIFTIEQQNTRLMMWCAEISPWNKTPLSVSSCYWFALCDASFPWCQPKHTHKHTYCSLVHMQKMCTSPINTCTHTYDGHYYSVLD